MIYREMMSAMPFKTMFGGMDWIPIALRIKDMTTTIFRYDVVIIATNGSRLRPTSRMINENGSAPSMCVS
jgi:hypothetical protein